MFTTTDVLTLFWIAVFVTVEGLVAGFEVTVAIGAALNDENDELATIISTYTVAAVERYA